MYQSLVQIEYYCFFICVSKYRIPWWIGFFVSFIAFAIIYYFVGILDLPNIFNNCIELTKCYLANEFYYL